MKIGDIMFGLCALAVVVLSTALILRHYLP
jgi:hypothetical protein